jgi:class 3 adenylate cyclase
MGAGKHDADELGTQLECVDVATGLTRSLPAAAPTSAATEKQFCASVLFADFQGYSKLAHHQARQFSDTVLRSIGDVLDRNSDGVILRRSWGDAIHAICTDVASGLELAFGFQAVCNSDLEIARLAPRLRVALHFGPMEHAYDAVEKRPTIFGAGLTFAARIEPITPSGSVLVSEAVVSEAALRGEKRFHFDYAGKLELAKGYGRHRMFLARRATTSDLRYIH